MPEQAQKARRVTIDLTPTAALEVERLRKAMGISTADVFRHALSVLRLFVQSKQQGQEVYLVDPKDTSAKTRIEVPFMISQGDESGD